MHKVSQMLQSSIEELTAEALRRIWGLPGYDEEHMLPEDLATRVAPNLRLMVACLVHAGPLEETSLAAAREIGHSRALQGVPVDAVALSWSIGERIVLDRLLALAELLDLHDLREAVHRLGDTAGQLARLSLAAYRQTQAEVTAHYDHLTADLVAGLSGERPADPQELNRRARTVGSDPLAAHAAVTMAINVARSDAGAAYMRMQRHVLAALATESGGRILVGSLDENPLILVPAQSGPEPLARRLELSLNDERRPIPVVLGVSEHAYPLTGVGTACREAHMAMQVGLRLGWIDRVVRYGTVLPEVLLLRNPDIAELLDRRLRPLRERPDLLETVQTYLSVGMSARAAARALFVHPNTVLYRLKVAQKLLGRDLTDVDALADLVLAVRGSTLTAG